MGMGFTDREEHQERESPAQHVYSPAPDSELQPLPFILRPTQCGSPSPLSSGHEWDCLVGIGVFPSDVRSAGAAAGETPGLVHQLENES